MGDKDAKQRLTALRVDEVSLVDNPANKKTFAVIKRNEEGRNMGKTTDVLDGGNPEAAEAPVADIAEVVKAIETLTEALSVYTQKSIGDQDGEEMQDEAADAGNDVEKQDAVPAKLRSAMSNLARLLNQILGAGSASDAEKARGAKADDDEEDEEKKKPVKEQKAKPAKGKGDADKADDEEEDEEDDEEKGKKKPTMKGVKGFSTARRDRVREAAKALFTLLKDIDPDGFSEITGTKAEQGMNGDLLQQLQEALGMIGKLSKRVETVEGATGVSKVEKTDATDTPEGEGGLWSGVI